MTNTDIDITLEQALAKSTPSLKRKILHSVEVVRKGYALWQKFYSNERPLSLAFSGGKDSQALYHVAKIALSKQQWENVDKFISFTSVDPPELVRFVKRQYPDVRRVAPKKSIYTLAVEHQMLPSMRVRWCCADLKENQSSFTFIGIRREESSRRAKRNEVELMNHAFSGDFETLGTFRLEKVDKMKRQKKYKDYFDEHEESEVGCMGGKDRMTISPILYWTVNDVWTFLNKVIGATHCELYDQGYTRIGCICCPMASRKYKEIELKRYPYVKRKWIEAIKAIRREGERWLPNSRCMQVRTNTGNPNPRYIIGTEIMQNNFRGGYMFKDGHLWLNKNYPPLPQMRINQTYKDVMGFLTALRLTAPMKSVKTRLRKLYSIGGFQENHTRNGIPRNTCN